jgi:hypothetical protein
VARRPPRRPPRKRKTRKSSKLFFPHSFHVPASCRHVCFWRRSDSLPAPHRRGRRTAGGGKVQSGSADRERPSSSGGSRESLGLVDRLAGDLAPPNDQPPLVEALDGAAQRRTLEAGEHEIRGVVLRRVARNALGLSNAEDLPRHPTIQLRPCLRYRRRNPPPEESRWRPQRDSNPCRGLERAVS